MSKEMDEEANIFACLILMPKALIEEDLKNLQIDLAGNDKALKELAEKYGVTMSALFYRQQLLLKHKV